MTRSLSCHARPHRPPLFLFPFRESFLSLPPQHLRCCLQNPVLYHRPSCCVCLRARLNSREYPACSNQNSCFSWTGLYSWMVSIESDTTILKSGRCHARSETSGDGEGLFFRSQVRDKKWLVRDAIVCDRRPQETYTQQLKCTNHFTMLSSLLLSL